MTLQAAEKKIIEAEIVSINRKIESLQAKKAVRKGVRTTQING